MYSAILKNMKTLTNEIISIQSHNWSILFPCVPLSVFSMFDTLFSRKMPWQLSMRAPLLGVIQFHQVRFHRKGVYRP